VYATRREGGLSAQQSSAPDRAKYPSHRRHGWARYRRFLRHSWSHVIPLLGRLVRSTPPPYTVRPPGTPGRPPTPPRDVVRFLLLRALGQWSYDEVHAILCALPSLARTLGFGRIPAAPTVAAWAPRVPPEYLTQLLGRLGRRIPTHGPSNLAGDGTGLSLHRWEQWRNPCRGSGDHRAFLKLHALVVTRADYPYFLAARLTDDRTNDVTELPALVAQLSPHRRVGNVVLDRGYVSRVNAQAIAEVGGRPIIALRKNTVRVKSRGVAAWGAMVYDQFHRRREFGCRYRRRAVIEGVFGAFKDRFGSWVRSRRRETQVVEVLSRLVVWNALAVSYHLDRV
jgi:transposase